MNNILQNNISRNQTIDTVRGIAIVLMVIGHCNHFFDYNSLTTTLIYGFHMPLFLIIAGVTMSFSIDKNPQISINQFVMKKAKSILIPYFIVGVISIFLTCMMSGGINTNYIGSLLQGQAKTAAFGFNLPLWFLPMLFLSQCIFFCINQICKQDKKICLAVSIVVSIFGWYLCKYKTLLIWNFDIALFVQVFLYMGYYFYKPLEKQLMKVSKPILAIIGLSVLVVYVVCAMQNGRVDLNARYFGMEGLYFLNAIIGTISMICIGGVFQGVNAVSSLCIYLGKNSLAVLCWHIPVSSLFYSYVLPLTSPTMQQVLWGVYGTFWALLALLLFTLPVSVLIHKIVFEK